jgi:hypothetical protein
MTTVIEYTEGHYEVQKTSYGQDYVWHHEALLVECECGHRPVLSASQTLCGSCGRDHGALLREVLAAQSRVSRHPWEEEYERWRKQQEEYLISEETYWLELSTLD